MSTITGETLVAIAGALGGGVLVKLIDRRYQLKEKSVDISEAFRRDLRLDIDELKKELTEQRRENDTWREKYYAMFEKHAILEAKYLGLLEEQKQEEE